MISGSRDYGFLQAEGMIKVDYDLIDKGVFDYDINDFYYFYQTKPFTGLCYQYSSGFVLTEQLCVGGLFVKTIGFDPDETGRISKYEEKHFGKTDRIWSLEFVNGSYKKIESHYIDYRCKGNTTSMLTLFFNEQKQINQLIIDGEGNYSYASLLVLQDDLPVDFKTFDELLAKEDIFAEDLLSYQLMIIY